MSLKNLSIILLFLLLPAIVTSLPVSSFTVNAEKITPEVYTERYSYFRLLNRNKDFRFPAAANQKIIRRTKKNSSVETIVKTGKFRHRRNSGGKYLADTPLLNIRNRRIQSAAEKLKQERDPLSAVSGFVFRHISDKITGIPIVSASSVMENRSGDCTEHAVLTTSLFRAMGIPARAVMGMILVPEMSGQRDVMVYHMWTEVFCKGSWRIADSTRAGKVSGNRYIAFCYHDLKTEMPVEYMNAMSSIYGLRVIYIKK